LKKYRKNDAIYKGQIDQHGKRNGYGVLVYKNKERVYEGQWVNDNREGQGYERFKNRSCYIGEFKDNKLNGRGVYKWANGEVYDGEFSMGMKEGHGVWKGISGDCYIG
jgi:hypothetical protein